MGRAKKWPVAGVEVAEKRAFGNDEEQASNGCNDVACSIEEEELSIVRFECYCLR